MKWVLVWVAMAGAAGAEEWRVLAGDQIAGALVSRVVVYDGGQRQSFTVGATTYDDGGRISAGSWRVEGDRYCSVWPPSDLWACYGVEVKGIDIRFVRDGGEVTVGRYGDLG